MVEIEEMLSALHDAVQAMIQHDKARDEYDGHSWDYAGRGFIEAKEHAAERFRDAMEAYIDSRVHKALDISPEYPRQYDRLDEEMD